MRYKQGRHRTSQQAQGGNDGRLTAEVAEVADNQLVGPDGQSQNKEQQANHCLNE